MLAQHYGLQVRMTSASVLLMEGGGFESYLKVDLPVTRSHRESNIEYNLLLVKNGWHGPLVYSSNF